MTKRRGSKAGKEMQALSGFFRMELAKPLDKILNAGYEVVFASPTGKSRSPILTANLSSLSQTTSMNGDVKTSFLSG